LAVIALGAGVSGFPAGTYRDFLVLPSSKRVSFTEIIEILAHVPKPVKCTGSVVEGLLQITYQTLSAADELEAHYLRAEAIIGAFTDGIRRWLADSGPDTVLEASVGGESLRFTLGEFATWVRDYEISGVDFSLGARDPRSQPGPAVGQVKFGKAVGGFSMRIDLA